MCRKTKRCGGGNLMYEPDNKFIPQQTPQNAKPNMFIWIASALRA